MIWKQVREGVILQLPDWNHPNSPNGIAAVIKARTTLEPSKNSMHRSRIPWLRIPSSSPPHDTLPVIARMLLSVSQEILRPVEVSKYMHCRRAEVGSTLQALPDVVHAVVDMVS